VIKIGAFIIIDISFKTRKDRKRFEQKYIILKKNILVDENFKGYGFAWLTFRNPELEPIYFMNFMGYGDPKDILKECLKEGIKIKFFAFNPINDKNSTWTKLRGRW